MGILVAMPSENWERSRIYLPPPEEGGPEQVGRPGRGINPPRVVWVPMRGRGSGGTTSTERERRRRLRTYVDMIEIITPDGGGGGGGHNPDGNRLPSSIVIERIEIDPKPEGAEHLGSWC